MRFVANAVVVVLAASCGTPVGHSAEAESEIRKQLNNYLAALDAADTNLAATVWRTSADLSFIHPGGHARGWEEMKKVYEFFGTTFSERKLTARDIRVTVNGETAWAEFYWHFDAKPVGGGDAVASDGRETQVYAKSGDRWELVQAHYSGPAMEFQQ